MSIDSKYNPLTVEDKWYSYWLENGFFKSVPDEREPYTIVIPPPNVTGVLHMGHMLNNTIQDILIRRARMQGKNACWVPGTDHASIATEAKVVAKLKSEGIKKTDMSRDAFLDHAWEWTHKHGGIILEQLKKLGASCDWDRTCFTMDEARSESVIKVFIDLYNKGLIYRGVRMVNWDPAAQTAVSDEEVIYKEEQSKLYYVRYLIEGTDDEWITVATTRPETILGDTAVCVNPKDKRFRHLNGKRVLVPLVNRSVPVITDDYVDMEFGTGCLKITPAHDANDYEIGLRHNLEVIDTFNDDGTLSEAAGLFIGEDRFEVRHKIVPELEIAGNLVKVEPYTNKVGYSERTSAVIEPKLSAQWFLKMTELAKPALEAVESDEVEFHPKKFKNLYRHWMSQVKDWCISRQLWWGHRIPVYYLSDGSFVVAENETKALELSKIQTGNQNLTLSDLRQEEDVLDTWASSWLWPISVFDGFNPENNEIEYYYPTNDLVTGHDIIFFWVARMIIAGYEFRQTYPFKNVYFTGMVRDKQGRKMSKQLGNSPDPLELIKQFGADGVRVGMLLCSPAGGDLLFDENLTEQGRNFANKIWNAFRLVKSWEVDEKIEQPEAAQASIHWFSHKLNETLGVLDDHFTKFRISDALMSSYTLFRDDFSGWLLEAVKPDYQKPIDAQTYAGVIDLFEKLLKILHPFMPFITEELYQTLKPRTIGDSIMISLLPEKGKQSKKVLSNFEEMKEVVSAIRNIRKEKNLPMKEALALQVEADEKQYSHEFLPVLKKLSHLSSITFVDKADAESIPFLVKTTAYAIPVGGLINVEEEIEKIKKELAYNRGFLEAITKKLSNERFVNNAPQQVVDIERKKLADTEAKIGSLQENLKKLQN